jgi:hypothetical protein
LRGRQVNTWRTSSVACDAMTSTRFGARRSADIATVAVPSVTGASPADTTASLSPNACQRTRHEAGAPARSCACTVKLHGAPAGTATGALTVRWMCSQS